MQLIIKFTHTHTHTHTHTQTHTHTNTHTNQQRMQGEGEGRCCPPPYHLWLAELPSHLRNTKTSCQAEPLPAETAVPRQQGLKTPGTAGPPQPLVVVGVAEVGAGADVAALVVMLSQRL